MLGDCGTESVLRLFRFEPPEDTLPEKDMHAAVMNQVLKFLGTLCELEELKAEVVAQHRGRSGQGGAAARGRGSESAAQ